MNRGEKKKEIFSITSNFEGVFFCSKLVLGWAAHQQQPLKSGAPSTIQKVKPFSFLEFQ